MATITEDYVSFETAKLLKEKGFSESTICKYAGIGGITEKWYDDYRERVLRFDWDEGYLIEPPIDSKDQYEIIGDTIAAPTLQMAMKWLREVHNIGIFPSTYTITNSKGSKEEHVYGSAIVNLITFDLMCDDIMPRNSYEEACETAIKYCLENLI